MKRHSTQLILIISVFMCMTMPLIGCAQNQLVADVSTTWTIPDREMTHTDALDYLASAFKNPDIYQTDSMEIAIISHTLNTLEAKMSFSDAQISQYREQLNQTEYTEDFENPLITDIPEWQMYRFDGSTQSNGDITIRHRIFVAEDFKGYDSMTNDARESLAVNAIMFSNHLGIPKDINFHFPQINDNDSD